MNKEELLQVVIRKVRAAMERDPNLDTQAKVAAKAGISQGHVSKLLLGEAEPTTGTLWGLAKALKCQPWELLVNEEATRRAAIEKILGGQGVPDEVVERHIPPAPAMRRRKKAG